MPMHIIALEHVRFLLSLDEEELKTILKILDKAPALLTLPSDAMSDLVGDILDHLNRKIVEIEEQQRALREMRKQSAPQIPEDWKLPKSIRDGKLPEGFAPTSPEGTVLDVELKPSCEHCGFPEPLGHSETCDRPQSYLDGPKIEPEVKFKSFACIDCKHETPPGSVRCESCEYKFFKSRPSALRCTCRVNSKLVEYDYHEPKCRFRWFTETDLRWNPPEEKPAGQAPSAEEVAHQNPPEGAQAPHPRLKMGNCSCSRRFWAPANNRGMPPRKCANCMTPQGRDLRINAIESLLLSLTR